MRALSSKSAALMAATLAALLLTPVAAATITMKNVSIEPPAGWTRGDEKGNAFWQMRDGETSCTLVALPSHGAN